MSRAVRFEPYFGSFLKHMVPIYLAFFLGLYCRDKVESEAIIWFSRFLADGKGDRMESSIAQKILRRENHGSIF
jgi:hypothetical protein